MCVCVQRYYFGDNRTFERFDEISRDILQKVFLNCVHRRTLCNNNGVELNPSTAATWFKENVGHYLSERRKKNV